MCLWSPVTRLSVAPQYLAVDVRRLNATHLRCFREGVAAALGVSAGNVHINRLNVRPRLRPLHLPVPDLCYWSTLSSATVPWQDKKNGVELFVSSDSKGTLKPRPADEVIHALDVGVLHRHLGHFGITEVSSAVGRGHRDHRRGGVISL